MPRMRFGTLRDDEPCWFIEERYAFARFCPWCGTKLPEHSFEEKPDKWPNQSSEPTPASGTSPAGQEPRLP
jgi:hypothetical protein